MTRGGEIGKQDNIGAKGLDRKGMNKLRNTDQEPCEKQSRNVRLTGRHLGGQGSRSESVVVVKVLHTNGTSLETSRTNEKLSKQLFVWYNYAK